MAADDIHSSEQASLYEVSVCEPNESRGVFRHMPKSFRKSTLKFDREDHLESIFKIAEALCGVHKYNLELIAQAYRRLNFETNEIESEKAVLHVCGKHHAVSMLSRNEGRSSIISLQRDGSDDPSNIFIFENGPIIVWDEGSAQQERYLSRKSLGVHVSKLLEPFSENKIRLDQVQDDKLQFCYVDDLPPDFEIPLGRIDRNRIYLKTKEMSEKLAVSFALAQSVRLDVYEAGIDIAVNKITQFPKKLESTGIKAYTSVLPITRDPRRDIGLVWEILEVNLMENFLDVPEYFWADDEWQYFWHRMTKYLELEERITVLNKRYKLIQEVLLEINGEKSTAHENRLSWIVIVFVFLQAVMVIVNKFVFKDRH